MKNSPQS